MRYYLVSDTHGFYSATRKALSEAGFFEDKEPHKLVILGDLLDRGTEANEMVAFVEEEMDKGELIYIRGNHEDLFLEMHEQGAIPYSYHVSNGTYDTAQMLGGFLTTGLTPPDKLKKAMEESIYFRKLIPASVDYHETEHYIFVHGWIPMRRYREHHTRDIHWREREPFGNMWTKARWLNGMEMYPKTDTEGKTIVCGHWHASYGHSIIEGKGSAFGLDADFTPFRDKGIIAIDACTARSGFVNCVVVED